MTATEASAASQKTLTPRPRLGRRELLGGAGLAALGSAAGLGYLLNQHPTAAASSERQVAGHLLRRAGFSPGPGDVDKAIAAGPQRTADQLLHPEKVNDSALETRLAETTWNLESAAELRRWWMTRMVFTQRPLAEKMTLFWHGLLTSSFRKAEKGNLMYVQNEFLRAHGLGKLRDLLIGISKDGAMLRWLDGTGSSKAHPNENYARELMELFTLGVDYQGKPNYSEVDVRESARALTGWYVGKDNTVGFRPRAHDDGVKTFLGRTGNLGLEDVVDTILAHPAAAHYISSRLWSFFAYPNPDDSAIQPVVEAFHRTGGDIREMVGAIFASPEFYSARAYRAAIKAPAELVAGLARQWGLALDVNAVNASELMGQALLDPPNVAGWPGGPDWITTGTWMARMRFLLYQSEQAQHALLASFQKAGAGKPEAVVSHAVRVMVDGELSAAARDAIIAHAHAVAGSAGEPSPALAREVVFMVGATPEYQLA